MGHRHICCDGCQGLEFRGRRFRCMRCLNYDLCGDCYDQRIETQAHSAEHPMQLIHEPGQEPDLLLGGGELELVHLSNCYTCPICGFFGYTARQLIKHVYEQHPYSEDYVVCPMCASVPGVHLLAIRNLLRHLMLNHGEQAQQMEPAQMEPPLRRTLTRSSQRLRRRRHLQQLPHQQLSRDNGAMLAIDDVSLPQETQETQEPQESQGRSEHEEILFQSVEPSGNQLGDGYLLVPWVAEQERRWRDTERAVTQKRRHALFAEHLLLSMLSAEELQLPEKWSSLERSSKQQHGLSKAMSLMSVPWTRLRQVSQVSQVSQVDARRDRPARSKRAEAGTEEEEAID